MLDLRKVWSSPQLPTLPAVAVKLLDLSRDPLSEIEDFVDGIKADPAISAKLLKAANSTFFGFSSKVTSLDRAVPLLGTTVVTSLALSFSLSDGAMTRGPLADYYAQYWLQSMVQAAAAEAVSAHFGYTLGCDYFLCGLLLDLGRLALLKTCPEQYMAVLAASTEKQLPLEQVEVEMLGADHTFIGSELMKSWNLPEGLQNSARMHHLPLAEIQAAQSSPDYRLIQAAAVSGAVGDYFQGPNKGLALIRLRELTSALLDFSEARLEKFLSGMTSRVSVIGEMLSIRTDDLGDPADLIALANEQLSHLALREHAASTVAKARQEEAEAQNRQLETRNERLQQQALRDPLTGTYNRHFFDEALNREVFRCCRCANTLALVFIDIDHFKRVNDTFGHQFGDQVLRQVAQAIGNVIRNADTLARFGGEEFVVLVNNPTEKGVQKLAERIRVRLESEKIVFEGDRVPVTASIGSAISIPGREDPDVATRLLEAADQAMYEAKQAGRNCVRFRMMMTEQERYLVQAITQARFSRFVVNQQVVEIDSVMQAIAECPSERTRIGELARRFGVLDTAQVNDILSLQDKTQARFGEIALHRGYLTREQLIELLALQQEDPRQLGACLVRLGFIDQKSCYRLLESYWSKSHIAPIAAPAGT